MSRKKFLQVYLVKLPNAVFGSINSAAPQAGVFSGLMCYPWAFRPLGLAPRACRATCYGLPKAGRPAVRNADHTGRQGPQAAVRPQPAGNSGWGRGFFVHYGQKMPSGGLLGPHEGGVPGGALPPQRVNENANGYESETVLRLDMHNVGDCA